MLTYNKVEEIMMKLRKENIYLSKASVIVLYEEKICTEPAPVSHYIRVAELLKEADPDFNLKG